MPRPTFHYRSTPMTVATKCGDQRKFPPIPQIEDINYAFEQDYEQLSTSFAPVPLNTVSPDDATAFLQLESKLSDQGGGIAKWTRTYFQIPPSWDDWENISYTFPGTPGYLISPSGIAQQPVGREAYTPSNGVKCRVHYDYFMVGQGRTYATEGEIPDIPVQTIVGATNPTYFTQMSVVDNVGGTGGTVVGSNFYYASTPDKTTYFGWVANAAAKGWASGRVGTADANPGQIVISCKPQRVAGNIWARVTRSVLAQ